MSHTLQRTISIALLLGLSSLATATDLKTSAAPIMSMANSPEIAQMKQDMMALQNELSMLKNTMPARTATAPAIDNSKIQIDAQQQQINDLKKQMADLKAALTTTQSILDKVKQMPDPTTDVADMKKTLSDLKHQVMSTSDNDTLAHMVRSGADPQSLPGKVYNLQTQINQIRAAFPSLSGLNNNYN